MASLVRAHHRAPVFLPHDHFTEEQYRALDQSLPVIIEVAGRSGPEARIYRHDPDATLHGVYEATGARTFYVAQPKSKLTASDPLAPAQPTSAFADRNSMPTPESTPAPPSPPHAQQPGAVPTPAAPEQYNPLNPFVLPDVSVTPNLEGFVDLYRQAAEFASNGRAPPPGSSLAMLANAAYAEHLRSIRAQQQPAVQSDDPLTRNAGHTPFHAPSVIDLTSPTLSAASRYSSPTPAVTQRVSAFRAAHSAPPSFITTSVAHASSEFSSPMQTSPSSTLASPMTITPTSPFSSAPSVDFAVHPSPVPISLFSAAAPSALSTFLTPSAPTASDSAGPRFVFPPPSAPLIPPAQPSHVAAQTTHPGPYPPQPSGAPPHIPQAPIHQQRNATPNGQPPRNVTAHASGCCPVCRRNIDLLRATGDNHYRLSITTAEMLRQGIHFIEDLIYDVSQDIDTALMFIQEGNTRFEQDNAALVARLDSLTLDLRSLRAALCV